MRIGREGTATAKLLQECGEADKKRI